LIKDLGVLSPKDSFGGRQKYGFRGKVGSGFFDFHHDIFRGFGKMILFVPAQQFFIHAFHLKFTFVARNPDSFIIEN